VHWQLSFTMSVVAAVWDRVSIHTPGWPWPCSLPTLAFQCWHHRSTLPHPCQHKFWRRKNTQTKLWSMFLLLFGLCCCCLSLDSFKSNWDSSFIL
jgi:hypothetical protein